MIDPKNFIAIGEKVHCSRVYKSGGIKTVSDGDGGEAVRFVYGGKPLKLPIPVDWSEISPAYADGKIKHVAVAIHTAIEGEDEKAVETALKYLFSLVEEQAAAGAALIDLNVDEFSPHTSMRVAAMKWLASTLAVEFPDRRFAIDSSDPQVLAAGLEAASINGQRHMANSISLERTEAIDAAVEFQADVMASATGRETMPTSPEQKVANLTELFGMLEAANLGPESVYIDPLVLPLSTGSDHGRRFLDSVAAIVDAFPGMHISGGLSNVSFGMPARKLLNRVFVHLAVQAGCDGGIIDPVETSVAEAMAMDTGSDAFTLARACLLGEDEYGMEFIQAFREGKLD